MTNRLELWAIIAKEAYEAQQQRLEATYKERKLIDQLKALSDNKSATCGEYVFALSFRKGSVDYKRIPSLVGIDLDEYRSEDVETWKLLRI